MNELIHPTAIIEPSVELDSNVTVGAFSVIRGRVQIGKNSIIDPHVVIGSPFGSVVMGESNHIYSGAVIGGPPQDLKYKGEATRLEMGRSNQIREFVTINIGTETGGGVTRLGDHNLLMAYVHVAHDCDFGSHNAIANATNFAGHVKIEDHVRVGGVCAFNQFIRIGKYAFIAGDSAVNKDVMPFTMAQGRYAVARAANAIGLERAGFPADEIDRIYRAVRILTKGQRTLEEALEEVKNTCLPSEHVQYLLDFIRSSERGVAR